MGIFETESISIETIAFKGYDDPPVILEFIEKYINHDKLFDGALKKKIKMFYEALNWDLPVDKQNSIERFF